MNARQLIEAEDPRKALRNRTQGLGYREREIDRTQDKGWNFYIGTPIVMSFNIVARDIGEATRLANAHFDRIMTQGAYLNDELDTNFTVDPQAGKLSLSPNNCMMWWDLDAGEEDPTMNPDFTPELTRS